MYEREKREMQEGAYYENLYAQEMLAAGYVDEYVLYLETSQQKLKSGMAITEIEAVQTRVKEAVQAHAKAKAKAKA